MDSMAHAPEPVALHPWDSGYRRLPEDTNPVSVPEPPKDFVVWSLFNAIFLNYFCCLGFLALVFSIKSRDRKIVGDLVGAQHYGATAKVLNIMSTTLMGLSVAVAVTLVIYTFTT